MGATTTSRPANPMPNATGLIPAQPYAAGQAQPYAKGPMQPYATGPAQGYQGVPPVNGIQPLGARTSGFYQAPYPQPPNYLPFGSGTTLGPTPQYPGMENFNFMAPGGGQNQQQQPAPAPQAPQQTGLSKLMDVFLGKTPSGRSGVRMFGGMGVPGLGPGSLGAIDRAVQDGRLPSDYRVPFRNQVGVGFGTPTFNQ